MPTPSEAESLKQLAAELEYLAAHDHKLTAAEFQQALNQVAAAWPEDTDGFHDFLADEIGISRAAVKRWQCGQVTPAPAIRIFALIRIQRHLVEMTS